MVVVNGVRVGGGGGRRRRWSANDGVGSSEILCHGGDEGKTMFVRSKLDFLLI